MNAEQTHKVMQLILSAWPTQRQRMTNDDVKGMYAAYAAGLADLDAELVGQAISRLVRTSEWMPTVAAIRAAAGVIVHGQQTTGAEAWGSVMYAMRRYGSHRTPGEDFQFDDPLTARIVRAFGWLDLCKSSNAVADRARFIEAYDQMSKTERTEAQAATGARSNVLPLRGEARPLKENVELLLASLSTPSGGNPDGDQDD